MDNLKAFLVFLESEKKYSRHTIYSYKKDLVDFIKFCELNHVSNISKAKYTLIRNFIVFLSKKGLKTRSINRKISSLNSFYDFLIKISLIKINPLENHKSLKTEKLLIEPFSQKEIETVIKNIDTSNFSGLRNQTIIELFYQTGIRLSELISLEINDIDFNQNRIKVLGKRNKERIIPILDSLSSILKRYIIERNKVIKSNIENLFVTENEKKLYPSLVYRVVISEFKKFSKKSRVSPHVLRHSFASLMINSGADINVVKEILGHESLAATQEYTKIKLPKIKDTYRHAHPRSKN